jgi:hypothetical protein
MRSFRVDEVEAAREPLPVSPLGERYPKALVIGGDPTTPVIDHGNVPPLLAAVSLAFSQHRPLVLSPDAVWITIAHGVVQHIQLHADRLRHQLVRHDGRKELSIRADAMPTDTRGWTSLVTQLRSRLAEEIGEDRARLFECDFSTSSDVDRLVSQVVLLDAYSPYFAYEFTCICGIPEITLLGTVDDWKTIRARIDVLAELDLAFWCRSLAPIVDHFVRAAQGDIDVAFWRRIYNPKDAYGGELVTGWITRLYPYLEVQGPHRPRNPMLELPLGDPRNRTITENDEYAVRCSDFPALTSRVQVVLDDAGTGTKRCVQLVAGVVAVTQDDRGALCPISGWHLEHAPLPLSVVVDLIARDHRVVRHGKKGWRRWFSFSSQHAITGPAELVQLYDLIDCATLFAGKRQWRLLPPTKHARVRIEAMGHLEVLRIADLPEGRSLCVVSNPFHRQVHWIACRLDARAARRGGDGFLTLLDDPADIPVLGTSLAAILEAALASEGDIAHLETGRLAALPKY